LVNIKENEQKEVKFVKQTNRYIDIEGVRRCLGAGPEQVSFGMEVTPEQAKFLLKHCNRLNRHIKSQHVERLRRDMESGNWYADVDYIGFNSKGMLVNGQHRLKALAGAKVESVLLKFDLNVEQHLSMDTGKNRTYSDQSAIFKRVEVEILPSRFRAVLMAGLKLSDPRINLSNTELAQLWKRYSKDLLLCEQSELFNLGAKIKIGSNVVRSSLLWAHLSGVPMKALAHIAEVLRTGITRSDVDIPVIRLRDELMDIRGGGRENDLLRAKYTQQCVFNYLDGYTSARLPSNAQMHYQGFDLLGGVDNHATSSSSNH
jgi:ribosomal protein S15P/S13E